MARGLAAGEYVAEPPPQQVMPITGQAEMDGQMDECHPGPNTWADARGRGHRRQGSCRHF